MNAVVYARFSSHRQGEQSIEGQVAEAERFAALHDLKIVHVYADRAQTGRNDNREQFQQMLSDAAKHAFDALIVWKTDRIGRNKEEIALNKYHLKKNGVKIYYVAEAIPDTPEGIILESVIEGMAAYYSEQLSQNVRRGMRASAMKAQCTGGTRPLGYTTDENKKFIIDPKHAPTVKLVFDLYAQGKTVTEIVNELNARGLRTLKGKPFTHNSLHRMLKNKKYIGVYSYNNEVCIENAIPPIVDTETFNKVQELLKYNQKAAAHKKAKVDYLLTEKLFCGKCGTMMVGVCGTSKTGTRHHYYICTAQKKKLCTKKAVRQLWIENVVIDYAIELVNDEALLKEIAENTYQYYLAQNTDTSYTKSLQKAYQDTEKSISNLLKAIEAGIFNESTKARMDELEEQKAELKSALTAAKLKEDLSLKKEDILEFLHQFTKMDYTDLESQKRLIKTFINSVFVYDDKLVLTFNYSGDKRTITIKEIDAGLQQGVRIPKVKAHQKIEHFVLKCSIFIQSKGLACNPL
ncbi:MAG: recombinase family protein [Clostridia bacterium]|nr:recombinase family protein [Clostridia bacterium]